jgi:hypothetical protein
MKYPYRGMSLSKLHSYMADLLPYPKYQVRMTISPLTSGRHWSSSGSTDPLGLFNEVMSFEVFAIVKEKLLPFLNLPVGVYSDPRETKNTFLMPLTYAM